MPRTIRDSCLAFVTSWLCYLPSSHLSYVYYCCRDRTPVTTVNLQLTQVNSTNSAVLNKHRSFGLCRDSRSGTQLICIQPLSTLQACTTHIQHHRMLICLRDCCRDSTPGTLSDLRSASVNNTRLASIAVLSRIHTYVRHCSSPLFHDIGAFVEQLQQAVSDQEKKIIEQQKELRRKQAQAAAAARLLEAQEGEDDGQTL